MSNFQDIQILFRYLPMFPRQGLRQRPLGTLPELRLRRSAMYGNLFVEMMCNIHRRTAHRTTAALDLLVQTG